MVLDIINNLIENGYIDTVRDYEQDNDTWIFHGYKWSAGKAPINISIRYRNEMIEAYSMDE